MARSTVGPYKPHRPAAYPAENEYGAFDSYESEVSSYHPEYHVEGDYRQPVAIAFVDSDTALISTRRTGEIYALNMDDLSISLLSANADSSWGEMIRLADNVIAVAEHSRDEVVVLACVGQGLEVLARLSAPGFPCDIEWDADERMLLVSGKWSQRLYRWRLAAEDLTFRRWSAAESVDLPMCGGQVLWLARHRCILVVDAFGRDYVIVGHDDFQLQHHAQLYGHNVTDLAATDDGEFVFFPHQLLNEFARSVRTDITWGGLISNNIRWLRTERLLHESGEEIFKRGRFYPLGAPGNGAGDPSSMAVSSTGRMAITLGGTNRVAIGNEDDYFFRQADVGYRPVDCAYAPDEKRLVVVNQFSDSLSIVDLATLDVQHVALGKLREPNEIERGQQLFFSSRLSHDGWMSCHSCHSDGHTNGQLNDNFTDRTFGTPKRILSLLGQAETMPYAWNGAMRTLEDQIAHSIVSTMAAGSEPSSAQIQAIASFIRSLPNPPNVMTARGLTGESQERMRLIRQGKALFRSFGCADCHSGQHFTSPDIYDVGLVDEDHMRLFNPPSLLSVSQRQNALLHDGRAKSIRDVLEKERHQLSDDVESQEINALLGFLESL